VHTFLWLYLFLTGAAVILALNAAIWLLQFLFGHSSRLDRGTRPGRRRRGGLLGISSRVVFVLWSLMLLASGLVMTAIGRGQGLGCTLRESGSQIACEGFAGAEGLAWILSLPALLSGNTQRLLTLLRTPWGAEAMIEWPLPELAFGLIGPVLLLVALLGFARILGDVRRFWRG
jgi:hypothetical protein